MTREQKIEAYTMRLDGYTLQEIADKFGVSKQRIHQIIPGSLATRGNLERCIYPNIKAWLLEKEMSITSLSKLCGTAPGSISHVLFGISWPRKKPLIKSCMSQGLPMRKPSKRIKNRRTK